MSRPTNTNTGNGNGPYNRQDALQRANQIDTFSTALINLGVTVVKRHPVPTAFYAFGVLICLFFSGIAVSQQQTEEFTNLLGKLDHQALDTAEMEYLHANKLYNQHKGWFSCDDICQEYKLQMEGTNTIYQNELKAQQNVISDAKGTVGIFSTYGVEETRELFWLRFGQGILYIYFVICL